MSYAEYLKALLAPLRIYALDTGYGAAELTVLGAALDQCCAFMDETCREAVIQDAESFGLSGYAEIMPYIPVSAETDDRRGALIALLQTDSACFTVAALNRIIAGCGVAAVVEETGTQHAIHVRFPETTLGIPENFDAIKQSILQIMPCHLSIRYGLMLMHWYNLEEDFETFDDIENAGFTFADMAQYRLDQI